MAASCVIGDQIPEVERAMRFVIDTITNASPIAHDYWQNDIFELGWEPTVIPDDA